MNFPGPIWHEFADGKALARELAATIARRLVDSIAGRGHAVLVVSGGTTPLALFEVLSRQRLDWSRVFVTLADERVVPAGNPRANSGLVRESLLRGEAAEAGFVPLHVPPEGPEDAARNASERIARLPRPFNVAILGMGLDGHTASIFPDAPAELIDPACAIPVLPVHPDGIAEPRLSMTLAWLLKTRHICVHIEGEDKKRVLRQCLEAKTEPLAPIARVFHHAGTPVHVFWAPSGESS
jgi:6-phosphogluconolactonase